MRLAPLALAVLGLGCASGEVAPGERAAAVSGGVADDGDPAVANVANCSAVLVAPRVLLTAAHCVDGVDLSGLEAFFGSDKRGAGTRSPILDARLHPEWDALTVAHDAALLLLADPSPVAPLQILPRPVDDALVGATVRSIGFGVTSPADPLSAGIKRQGTATLRSYDATTFTDDATPSATCVGDSGGAALITVDGTEYLAGIASRGDVACQRFDVKTRVDVLRDDFIQPYVDATQPGAAGLGAPCAYSAQCASGQCAQAPDDRALRTCTAACASDGDCAAGMTCRERLCRFRGPTPGALGSGCERDADCHSRACRATSVGGPRTCTVGCTPGAAAPCPTGYSCAQTTGGDFACVPAPAHAGCAVGGGAAPVPWLLLLSVVILLQARRWRALLLTLLLLAGCKSSQASCGEGAPQLALGTARDDGTGFVALTDGEPVPLVFGPQGGFHTWSNVRARNLCLGDVRLDRVARDPATGDVLVTLHDTLTLQPAGDGSGELPVARPTFLCPNDRGLSIPGRTIEVRATLTDKNGAQAADAHTMVPTCRADASASLCESLCNPAHD